MAETRGKFHYDTAPTQQEKRAQSCGRNWDVHAKGLCLLPEQIKYLSDVYNLTHQLLPPQQGSSSLGALVLIYFIGAQLRPPALTSEPLLLLLRPLVVVVVLVVVCVFQAFQQIMGTPFLAARPRGFQRISVPD